MEQIVKEWVYISEDKGHGSAQISPDGSKILVKEITREKDGGQSKYFLIDIETCKKSETEIKNQSQ